jgi:hypothetical protein
MDNIDGLFDVPRGKWGCGEGLIFAVELTGCKIEGRKKGQGKRKNFCWQK